MLDPVIVSSAIAVAMIYALAAFGLILTYRVVGVFNLALGYQAAFAAFLYWQFTVGWGLNRYVSAALILFCVAPINGALLQQTLFRHRRDVLSAIIITIGLSVGINGLIQVIWPPTAIRLVPSLFGAGLLHVAGRNYTVNNLGVILTTVAVGVALALFMRHSRTGLKMLAVVDSPELSAASGIAYGRISALAWILGTILATLAGILLAPLLTVDATGFAVLVTEAFAVTAFAGLVSMRLAVIGALLLSYAQTYTDLHAQDFTFLSGSARDALPFIMLACVLLLSPRLRREFRVVGGSLERAARRKASGSTGLAILIAVVLAAVAALISGYWAFVAVNAAVFAIVALSLVLLTGASAQISLCQATFMGVGAIVISKLLPLGVPWLVAALAGAAAAGGAGIVIALAAFRLRGLFLALISLAFADAASIVFFQNTNIVSFSGLAVARPGSVLGLSFTSDRAYLLFVVVALVLVIVLLGRILSGPWGRALQALSAGDGVASVAGLSTRLWKIRVFALSAAIAGFAGSLYAGANQVSTGASFATDQSFTILAVIVIGGITSPVGGVLAGVLLFAMPAVLQEVIPNAGAWSLVLFGLTATQVAAMYPDGWAGALPQSLPTPWSAVRARRAKQSASMQGHG